MSDTRRRLSRRIILAAFLGVFSPDALGQSICAQLEAELARSGGGATSFDQAYARQRAVVDRLGAASRRQGCDTPNAPRPASCNRIRVQISRAETTLRRIDRLRSQRIVDTSGRRAALVKILERNGCRPAATPTRQQADFFSILFARRGAEQSEPPPESGPRSVVREMSGPPGGAYRTLCVRSCDGYYWPISFGVSSRFFSRDAKACEASCPNQQVKLFVHRTSGEWSDKAVALDGTPYVKEPWAFAYRSVYKPECSCTAPGLIAARPTMLGRENAQIQAKAGVLAPGPEGQGESSLPRTSMATDAPPPLRMPRTPAASFRPGGP